MIKNTAGLCTIGSSSTVEMNFATPLVSGCRAKAGKGCLDWVALGEQFPPSARKEHLSQCVFVDLRQSQFFWGGILHCLGVPSKVKQLYWTKDLWKQITVLTYCPHLFAFSLFVYFLFEVGVLQVQVYSPNPRKQPLQPLRIHRQSTNHWWKLDTAVSRVSY